MQNLRLNVHLPLIKGSNVECTFDYNGMVYVNTYTFPQPVPRWMKNSPLLRWLALITSMGMFSTEYFTEVHCHFSIDESERSFFEKLFFLGLGEFRYVNDINILTRTSLSGEPPSVVDQDTSTPRPSTKSGKILLLNGGGKDGSTSAYLLSQAGRDFTWFQRGNSAAQSSVVKAWDKPVFTVTRKLDEKRKGKYAGHRPISSGIAILSLFTAEAFGYKYVIASNETSANEGNLTVKGFTVNHQYSKSLEFETDLAQLLRQHNVQSVYFSLLRPLNEIQIAKLFSHLTTQQMKAITSCNHGTKTGKWCLRCAKCAFVALAFTAIDKNMADEVLARNVINKPELFEHIEALVDPDVAKPLECVGTIDECQTALSLVLQQKDLVLSRQLQRLGNKFKTTDDNELSSVLRRFERHNIPPTFHEVVKEIKANLKD